MFQLKCLSVPPCTRRKCDRLFLLVLGISFSFATSRIDYGQAVKAVDFSTLAGEYTYSLEPDTPVSVYVQDGKLLAESDRMIPTELIPRSATEFVLAGSEDKIRFSLDGFGKGTALSIASEPNSNYLRTGEPVHHLFHDYRRSEVMITMRDGVRLHAVVLQPADIKVPLPILLQRTPYGVDDTTCAIFFARRPELARAGYIYVNEDIRGRYKSEGTFLMMRPLVKHNPQASNTAVDESTDTYDTVEWLVYNVSGNNGRVGVVGESYGGFLAMMAGLYPHPAVKAISPQAPMIDVWIGDDFFHNGAFRQSFGYDYVLAIESGKQFEKVSYGTDEYGKPIDGFDYFLDRGSFSNAVKRSGSRILPTWALFLNHPAYDNYWKSRGVEYSLNAVSVPILTVGGIYDQEDMYGPQEEYSQLEPHDSNKQNFLVLAPWRHGYWSSSSRRLGNLDFGAPVGKEFRAQIEAKFFGHYLKDESGFGVKDTAVFETGSDKWMLYDHFPPSQSRPTNIYLLGSGLLGWDRSTTTKIKSYVSDPGNPVPYRHRPIQPTYSDGSEWYNWLTEDQRFVTSRSDVAVWKLPVLKKDLTLTGEVIADIYVATAGTDNDLVVKLIDEYPEDGHDPSMRGYQLMTNSEIFRGRYLKSFERPEPLRAGSVREYKFSLHDVDHVFKAGHTLMVEIQSTWFPLYDRNPQTFVHNIMTAKSADFKPETITVYSGPGHNSALQLPLSEACGRGECF